MSDDEPTPQANLPDALLTQIDSMDVEELKQLHTYVEQRLDSQRQSLEAAIEADAAGEILDLERQGGYALVRKHPPDPDGPGVNEDVVTVYHVRTEQHPDGEEDLRWMYVGDVASHGNTRCETCGRTLDPDLDHCPHCSDAGGN